MLPSSRMLIYMPFDGSWSDASPAGNHATTVSGSVFQSGVFGKSAFFDGSDDYAKTASSLPISGATSSFSVCAWIKSSLLSGFRFFLTSDHATDAMFVPIAIYSSDFTTYFGGVEYETSTSLTGKYTAGTWGHFAVVVTGGKVEIFLNSTLIKSQDGKRGDISTAPLIFGCRHQLDYFGNGAMDDVVIFDYALSAAGIKQVMKGLHPIG